MFFFFCFNRYARLKIGVLEGGRAGEKRSVDAPYAEAHTENGWRQFSPYYSDSYGSFDNVNVEI